MTRMQIFYNKKKNKNKNSVLEIKHPNKMILSGSVFMSKIEAVNSG